MNIKNVETQIHQIAQTIKVPTKSAPSDGMPSIVYLMGRIASGKGYVLDLLKKELPQAQVISVSSVVSELTGALDRKSLQDTAKFSREITNRISGMLSGHGVRRDLVIVDGIRQPQILLPLMHYYGGVPVWVDATPTVRELRYNARGSVRDKAVAFAEADQLDIKLGVDALFACLEIIPETVIVENPFSLTEIKHQMSLVEKPKPAITRVSEVAEKIQKVKKVAKKASAIRAQSSTLVAAPSYEIPKLTTPSVTDIVYPRDTSSDYAVNLSVLGKPDIKIKVWTNSPARIYSPETGTAAVIKLIVSSDTTNGAIMTDIDGYHIFSAKGNRGVSLKRYLMGPNFSARNEDAKANSYLTRDHNTKVETETKHHFICVHAPKLGRVPVAITYYDVDMVSIITRPLIAPIDTGSRVADWFTRCHNSGIKCEVPEVFASWTRTGN